MLVPHSDFAAPEGPQPMEGIAYFATGFVKFVRFCCVLNCSGCYCLCFEMLLIYWRCRFVSYTSRSS